MRLQTLQVLLIGACAMSVAACAGGDMGGMASTSTSQVTSTPAPSPTIFANPVPTTYASAGTSGAMTGWGTANQTLGTVSSADSDQVHIRYAAGGYYEIQMPGAAWDRLVFEKGAIPADPATFNDFQPQSSPQNGAMIFTENARLKGYQYSELAAWLDFGTKRLGEVAFGTPTLSNQMPVTGSAIFHGIVGGSTDIVNYDSFDGYYRLPVSGTVDLGFNFGLGSLTGSMTLALPGSPSFGFKDTVFSVGSTTYSGSFDTLAAGQNYFLGQFTGPHAEETIGAWALPFIYGGDNQPHQAIGAWIAKQ